MKLLSIEKLKILAQQPKETCVSIFLPTHHAGSDTQQNPIRLRNLIREAEDSLIEYGWRSEDAKSLLQPVRELDEYEFWQHQSDSLAIFRSQDLLRYYCLPLDFAELAIVSNRFYLKPLLPLFNSDGHFYILALSHNLIRLLEGTHHYVEEIDLTGVVPSLEEALRFEDPERQISSHTGTPGAAFGRRVAPGGVTIFHGHGAGDEDKKENLSLYFHRVNEALRELLKDEHAPLVLAGVEYLLPIYREANTYSYLMDSGITGNAEMLTPEELHVQAWEIVEPYFLQAQQEAMAQYRELLGTGKASSQIMETIPAACQGRVDKLIVALGQQQWGIFNSETQAVQVHPHPEPNDEELLDFAATQTILNGGTVYAIESEDMPDNAPLAAVFRY
jgi:Bacterial archaeo-eukaryotic release factor family 7